MLTLDLHVDTLMAIVHEQRRLEEATADVNSALPPRQLDLPKMREGGLDAAVFSIFVTPYWRGPAAPGRAHALIDELADALRRPAVAEGIVPVVTVDDLRAAVASGRRGAFIGVEGGHAIDDSLERLREFAGRGIRYMTLTWSNANGWADSSGSAPVHGGLTPLGRDVIREMERLGVLVDVSHVSDATIRDVLDCASSPIIASHSGCRAVHEDHRNLTDAQLRAIAATGGVVGIPFHSEFLAPVAPGGEWFAPWRSGGEVLDPAAAEHADRRARPAEKPGAAPLRALVDHVLHALDVAGPEHVALGSDFDGMIVPPVELAHVGRLPALRAALVEAGVSGTELDAVWGGNTLRVFRAAEGAMTARGDVEAWQSA